MSTMNLEEVLSFANLNLPNHWSVSVVVGHGGPRVKLKRKNKTYQVTYASDLSFAILKDVILANVEEARR